MNAALKLQKRTVSTGGESYCDFVILLPEDFVLVGGERLTRPELSVRVYGDLSRPVIAVAGGISSSRAVADCDGEKGWWRDIVGPGCPIDLEKFCVIAFDFIPNEGELARRISTQDQAHALAVAFDSLSVEKLYAFAGASYGGMIALAFAEKFPLRVQNLCVVSAADRAHPAATAIRGVQRRIIQFARRHNDADEGVSLARQLAMITYRTPEEFAQRFDQPSTSHDCDRYEICNYLISRGRAFGLSAERYLALSDSLDRHTVQPSTIKADCLFVASQSDGLVPIEDMRRLAKETEHSSIIEIDTLYGHDAFLKETQKIGLQIKTFLEK